MGSSIRGARGVGGTTETEFGGEQSLSCPSSYPILGTQGVPLQGRAKWGGPSARRAVARRSGGVGVCLEVGTTEAGGGVVLGGGMGWGKIGGAALRAGSSPARAGTLLRASECARAPPSGLGSRANVCLQTRHAGQVRAARPVGAGESEQLRVEGNPARKGTRQVPRVGGEQRPRGCQGFPVSRAPSGAGPARRGEVRGARGARVGAGRGAARRERGWDL